MDHLLLPVGIAIFFAGAGAFFALGFAGVCRWLEWSPVNLTVNVYQNGENSPPPGTEG
jgi:hypothetical protein